MKKILLLKGDIYTESLVVYLETKLLNVNIYTSSKKKLFSILETIKFDCLILDTRLKNGEGLIFATKIIDKFPNQPLVLIATPYLASKYAQNDQYQHCLFLSIKNRQLEKLVDPLRAFLEGSISEEHVSFDTSKELITVKEQEILFLIAKGLTQKNIAMDLKISQKTVRNHLYSIRHKLGVESSLAAVVKALREGLI